MESLPDPVDCLLLCSSSPYAEVLPGPPTQPSKGELAISGWEKVRPRAVYDLTATSQEPRRRRRQFSDQALLRDVVSMPNLCTKNTDLETWKWSYMSGYLDEDFSYVYTGGLSERSSKANPKPGHKKSSSSDSQRTSVSTCSLTLDPASLFTSRHSAYVEPRTQYGEISKMFAMQLKPELLAQQLLIENRLRNVDLSTHPDLQRDSVRSGREKSDTESTNATSLAHAKSTHLQQTRKLRRQRRPKPKMWCPLPANEESHQQLPIDLSFNTRSQVTRHPNSDVAVNSKARLHNQFGNHAGIVGKKSHVQFPRSDEKSNKSDLKMKQRTATYHIIFDQDKHTQRNNLPSAGQAQVCREYHSQATIPVFIPSLEQEQAMIPKRFSKLTALQLKPPATSNVITDRLFYVE